MDTDCLQIVYRKTQTIVDQMIDGEYVLVPLQKQAGQMRELFTLNESGAFIWQKINGENTVSDIIEKVTENFSIDKETAQGDVLHFLQKMQDIAAILLA